MVRESLLERYVDHFGKGDDYENIFKRFSLANLKNAEKTKRDYNRDLYKILSVKFFRFWNFDKKFSNIAGNLAVMHILDLADVEIFKGKEDYGECEKLLDDAIIRTEQGKFLPGQLRKNKRMLPSRISLQRRSRGNSTLAERLLGDDFQLYQEKGNVIMQLRSINYPEDVRVKIRNQDRIMLDFVFAHYDDNLDSSFWPDFYQEERIGQVLGWLEKHGRTKTVKNKGNSKNTIARKMVALGRFERYLKKKNLVNERIMPDMDKPTKVDKPQIYLNSGDFRKLYRLLDNRCDNEYFSGQKLLSIRDRAMIGLLDITCARGSAISGLKMEHLDMEGKQVYVKEKGRRENILPIEGLALNYLKEFLKIRKDFLDRFNVEEQNREYVFHSKRGLPMNRRSLSRKLDAICKKARIRKKVGDKTTIGTHVIRRSAANALDKNEAPIHHIQKLMNHRHTSTTERYLSLGPVDLKKTVKKYHPRAK